MARLTEEKINEIRRLYSEIGIYSQVAKQVGCSPSTVKKICFWWCAYFKERNR